MSGQSGGIHLSRIYIGDSGSGKSLILSSAGIGPGAVSWNPVYPSRLESQPWAVAFTWYYANLDYPGMVDTEKE